MMDRNVPFANKRKLKFYIYTSDAKISSKIYSHVDKSSDDIDGENSQDNWTMV